MNELSIELNKEEIEFIGAKLAEAPAKYVFDIICLINTKLEKVKNGKKEEMQSEEVKE